MKKTVFALFAVLLAVLLVTCDLFGPSSGTEEALFTEDGRPMVRLTISVGNIGVSRALTTTQAQSAVDYYEVVFKDPKGVLHQEAWDSGTTSITIPVGNYTGATKAVVFAGVKSDKTLLAVGIITAVDGNLIGAGDAIIKSDTNSVTFTLSPLTNAVSTNKASTTFKIIGPTKDSVDEFDYSTANANSIPVTLSGGTYPVFCVPGGNYANTDSSPANLAENIVGSYSVDNPYFDGVILAAAWSATSGNYSGGGETGVTVVVDPADDTVGDPINGEFIFLIDASSCGDGLSKVYIDVPVYALGNTDITWHIKGGTTNSDPDGGAGTNGGAVLLAVGLYYDPPEAGLTISTGW